MDGARTDSNGMDPDCDLNDRFWIYRIQDLRGTSSKPGCPLVLQRLRGPDDRFWIDCSDACDPSTRHRNQIDYGLHYSKTKVNRTRPVYLACNSWHPRV